MSAAGPLTNEKKDKDGRQLVDSVSQDVLHHRAGNERFLAAVGVPEQQGLGGRLRGQSQGSEGVHDEVDPQHLHSLQRRVLETKLEPPDSTFQKYKSVTSSLSAELPVVFYSSGDRRLPG